MSRRRWIYTSGGRPLDEPIEVSDDWTDAPQGKAPVTDLYMDGVHATDGTDIGSRKKRREYMRRTGYADADDFKGVWEKAAKDRAQFFTGKHDTAERQRAIVEAFNKRGRH